MDHVTVLNAAGGRISSYATIRAASEPNRPSARIRTAMWIRTARLLRALPRGRRWGSRGDDGPQARL